MANHSYLKAVVAFLVLNIFNFIQAFASTGVTPPPTPVPLDPVSSSLLIGGGAFVARKVFNHYKK